MTYEEAQRDLQTTLAHARLVPVLVLDSVDQGLRICEILVREGLHVAEITFRTRAAPAILDAARAKFPELLLGAGTILTPDDLALAFDRGARFAVAPGFNPAVVAAAVRDGLAFSPGVCTPTDIERAYEMGARLLKFFPAEAAGGVAMLSAVAAPYRHLGLRYMPTGGVTPANAPDYWALPDVAAVGGTWLAKPADLAAGRWDDIARTVRAGHALSRSVPDAPRRGA